MYFYQYTLLLRYLLLFPTSFYSFFFNDTATTEIYTLSLHDALPICGGHQYVGNATRCMTVAERADGTSHPIARRGIAQQLLDRIGNGAFARADKPRDAAFDGFRTPRRFAQDEDRLCQGRRPFPSQTG